MKSAEKDRWACPPAGCSTLSWETEDGKHIWGRNFDYNCLAEGSQVTFCPAQTPYVACSPSDSKDSIPENRQTARYAAVGIGLLLSGSVPILYEGINEKGLMGGQLYYRTFAHYALHPRLGTQPLQPPFAVYHLLAQCATVEEVVHMIKRDVTLVASPLLGTVPPLHWAFYDRTGESVIIEPDREDVHVYRHTMGIMTNSPGYPWHRLNLLNYAGIRNRDYEKMEMNGESLTPCFSGSGAQGMPGDWSSVSRFVRLAFLKKYGVKGKKEEQGVAYMFRLLQSVSFPLGMVHVNEAGDTTKLDKNVLPYDYTVYTSVMCGESLKFYWTTYENQRIQVVDLHRLLGKTEPLQFPLHPNPDFWEVDK